MAEVMLEVEKAAGGSSVLVAQDSEIAEIACQATQLVGFVVCPGDRRKGRRAGRAPGAPSPTPYGKRGNGDRIQIVPGKPCRIQAEFDGRLGQTTRRSARQLGIFNGRDKLAINKQRRRGVMAERR